MSQSNMPSSAPKGAAMVFGLGAQKAGTTWLHAYLARHPQVHVPRCKEMHYFDALYSRRPHGEIARRRAQLQRLEGSRRERLLDPVRAVLSRQFPERWLPRPTIGDLRRLVAMYEVPDPAHGGYWRALLAGYRGQAVVADISPEYDMLSADNFAEMANIADTTKFIYLLRDPVDRTLSNAKMQHRSPLGQVQTGQTYDELLADVVQGKHRHMIRRSDYATILANLESVVPQHQRLYLFYETLFTDAAMQQLCTFLGIRFRPGKYGKVVHGSTTQAVVQSDVETALSAQMAPIYRDMAARFGDALPPRCQQRILP